MASSGKHLAQGGWDDIGSALVKPLAAWKPLTSSNADRAMDLIAATASENRTDVTHVRWHILRSGVEMAIHFDDALDRSNIAYIASTKLRWVTRRGVIVPSEANVNHRSGKNDPTEKFEVQNRRLSNITSGGILSAIEEFESIGRKSFLEKYGFGKSTEYFVSHDGKRYDSKAICGAAHGYDHPESGPLRPEEFSGGAATVRRTLEERGFDVEKIGPGWTAEERVLALDAYLQHGMASKTSSVVSELSSELNSHAFHPDAGTRTDFRNSAGVALKLANFASLDPEYKGTGMPNVSEGDRQTWNDYAGDQDLLRAIVAGIRKGSVVSLSGAPQTTPTSPIRTKIEQQHNTEFDAGPSAGGKRERREAALVEDFAQHLEGLGHEVGAHQYPIGLVTLRNDLADESTRTIWEAKSTVDRNSVRLAIGQLLDYRRFEPPDWQLGILLPREPHPDLLALTQSLEIHVAWRTKDGFQIS